MPSGPPELWQANTPAFSYRLLVRVEDKNLPLSRPYQRSLTTVRSLPAECKPCLQVVLGLIYVPLGYAKAFKQLSDLSEVRGGKSLLLLLFVSVLNM